jgi:serine/threonine protein kinase
MSDPSPNLSRCPSCGSFYVDELGACPREGTALEPSEGRIDRYQIVARVGQGSMGVVYRAQHTLLDSRVVAIKLLYRELARDPRTVNRFFREARAATAVQSPYIVEVKDFGATPDGDAFLVMEYIDGESLRELLTREKRLAIPRATTIALQIADGLQAAHNKGIVHRDLKPENVVLFLVEGNERVKLLDFGIAQLSEFQEVRLTETGIVLGTPAYMSPEQAAGERVDHRTDVYSLGTILYEMLTGSCPFEGESAKELLVRKLTRGYVPPRELRPEVPLAMEAVVLHALERKPDRRVSTMLELAMELREAVDQAVTGPMRLTPLAVEDRPGALPVPEEEPLPEAGHAPRPHHEQSLLRRVLPFAGIALGLVLGVVLTLLVTRSKEPPPLRADARPAVASSRRDAGRTTRPPDAAVVVRDPRRKKGIVVRPVKGKRVGIAEPRPPRDPKTPDPKPRKVVATGKWIATVTSAPTGAEVYDENDAHLGRTPLHVSTDSARKLSLAQVGSDSVTVQIPAHSTSKFHARLRRSTMSWEAVSLTQLKQMLDKGQISRFTYRRRRAELLRKRDEKLFELKIKLKVGEISQEQYNRLAKSLNDTYR